MDVTTAFLNGVIDEEIYMQQPPGYEKKGGEDLVCGLQKALYSLKQSPRKWNMRWTSPEKMWIRKINCKPKFKCFQGWIDLLVVTCLC